jgi:hypothetical protein
MKRADAAALTSPRLWGEVRKRSAHCRLLQQLADALVILPDKSATAGGNTIGLL